MGWRKVINRIKAERIPTPTPATRCKTRPNFTPRVNACSGPGSHASACARRGGTPAPPVPTRPVSPCPAPPLSSPRAPAAAQPELLHRPQHHLHVSAAIPRGPREPALPSPARVCQQQLGPIPAVPTSIGAPGQAARRRRLRPPRLPHRSPETPAQLHPGLISALGLISRHAGARARTGPYNSLLLGAEQGARLLSARVAGPPCAPSSSERVA